MRISVLIGHSNRDRSRASGAQGLEHDDGVFGVVEHIDRFDRDISVWSLRRPRAGGPRGVRFADGFANIETFDQLTEDRVVEVEEAVGALADKELRIVGVVGRFRERQDTFAIVLQIGVVIIVKLSQRRTARSGPGRVASLDHEVIDDPMKNDAVVKSWDFGWQDQRRVQRQRAARCSNNSNTMSP